MMQNRSFVRVWIDAGEIRFVNSREDPIEMDLVQIDGADVYSFEVSGGFMLADAIMAELSISDGALDFGSLSVENVSQR